MLPIQVLIVGGEPHSGRSMLARRIQAALRDLGVECDYRHADQHQERVILRGKSLAQVKQEFDSDRCPRVTVLEVN